MGNTALLVLDMQVNMFDEDFCVHNPNAMLDRIELLIRSARDSQTPIIFVRNDGGEGAPDEPGTPGFELHPRISPLAGDVVLDKTTSNAFKDTALEQVLQKKAIDHLVIAGIQTELCVRDTSLEAHKRGLDVTLVEDAHTTFDFEDQSAVEAIASLNQELRPILSVLPASKINFRN